jgi:putative ABC transport system permease protein
MIGKDIRYALRGLLRQPGFAIAAILSLGLGIGATTTIFTLINAAFLQSVPVPEPDRLILAYAADSDPNFLGPISYSNYIDTRQQAKSAVDLAAFQRLKINWTNEERPEQIIGQVVTDNYFQVLGTDPFLGRYLTAGDFSGSQGGGSVAVLSNAFWRSRFGANPGVLGRSITLNGQPLTVVGVAPRGFNGTSPFDGPDVWVPMSLYKRLSPFGEFLENRDLGMFEMVGRLQPGSSVEKVSSMLHTIGDRLRQQYPDANKYLSIQETPLSKALIEPSQRQTYLRAGGLLMTVVFLLLLIACANVASLLLTRGILRRREVAIRISIGAQRSQLVRQLLTEGVVLSLAGGVAGILLGSWGPSFLWKFRPPSIPVNALNLAMNARVLAFALFISVLTGIFFGLAPALQTLKADLVPALKDLAAPLRPGRGRPSWRSLLIMLQVAFSLLALIGAGLFLRSLSSIRQTAPGFSADKLVHMNFDLRSQKYEEGRGRAFIREVLERVRTLPQVSGVTIASNQLLRKGGWCFHAVPEGGDTQRAMSTAPTCSNTIGSDYFKTMGIPLRSGREFGPTDRAGTPGVVIVNETMAHRFWPGRNPVGERIRDAEKPASAFEVVGVVADAKYTSLSEEATPYFYRPLEQNYESALSLYVRAAGNPHELLEPVRLRVQEIDRALPIANVAAVSDLISTSLWAPRMGAILLSVFGLLALVLAVTGIYGIVGYSVSQRHREIGIRLAIGAQRWEVVFMILREVGVVVAFGLAIGLIAAGLSSRLIAGLLYGIQGADPLAYVGATLSLASMALLASYVAARRGAQIDPVQTLKGSGG